MSVVRYTCLFENPKPDTVNRAPFLELLVVHCKGLVKKRYRAMVWGSFPLGYEGRCEQPLPLSSGEVEFREDFNGPEFLGIRRQDSGLQVVLGNGRRRKKVASGFQDSHKAGLPVAYLAAGMERSPSRASSVWRSPLRPPKGQQLSCKQVFFAFSVLDVRNVLQVVSLASNFTESQKPVGRSDEWALAASGTCSG